MEEKARIKKILVVALDNLGDAVMATSVLKPLKSICPQAEIGMWVKTYTAGLFTDQPMIDHVHASDPFWDKSPGVGKGRFWDFIGTSHEIRARKYEVAFVLNAEWRRALACVVAGIPSRIGYPRRKSGPFLTQSFPKSDRLQHFVDDHRKLVELWSGTVLRSEECLPRLDMTPEERMWWQDWATKNKLEDKKYMVVHLFSGDEDKNWPLSCWVQLIQELGRAHAGLRFVVVCGPGEAGRLAAFHPQLVKEDVVELVAPSLTGLKAAVGHAMLVLGGDSGIGHVAAALGVPVLSLFGIGSPVRSRPLGRSLNSTIEKSPLRQLYVPDVFSRVEELMMRIMPV